MGDKPLIGLIGPGAMGEALIVGLLQKGITTPERILAAGPIVERGEELHQRYGVVALSDNVQAVKNADLVILSVKPQRINRVLDGLKNQIPETALVLSIVAGATIQKISEGLNHDLIIRAMPNTPAQIGEGISLWTASPSVSDEQLEFGRQVLTALGQEIYEEDEAYLDMATALVRLRPGLCVPLHGSADRRRRSHGLLQAHLRATGHPNHPGLGRLLQEERRPPCPTAQPGHFARWHLSRGAVLPGKSRLPHRHLPRHLGCLRTFERAG